LMVGALTIASDGWYWTYAVTLPLHTATRAKPPFFPTLLETHQLAAHAAIIVAPVLTLLGPTRLRFFWLPLSTVTLLMAHAGFTKDGGELNSLWPLYVAGVLCFSLVPIVAAGLQSLPIPALAMTVLVALVTIGGAAAAKDKLTWFRNRAVSLEREARRPNASPHTYPREQAFERTLRHTIHALPKPVFVGARFFGPRGPLNTHQTGLYEGMVRTQLFDPLTQLEPTLARHHYKSLVLWSYWHNENFDRLVQRYYVEDRALGNDPLIGLRVNVWLPKSPP